MHSSLRVGRRWVHGGVQGSRMAVWAALRSGHLAAPAAMLGAAVPSTDPRTASQGTPAVLIFSASQLLPALTDTKRHKGGHKRVPRAVAWVCCSSQVSLQLLLRHKPEVDRQRAGRARHRRPNLRGEQLQHRILACKRRARWAGEGLRGVGRREHAGQRKGRLGAGEVPAAWWRQRLCTRCVGWW